MVEPQANTTFKDVSTQHFAFTAIKTLSEKGLMKGYNDGTFKPERPVLRREYVVLFMDVLNIPMRSYNVHLFADLGDIQKHSGLLDYAGSAEIYLKGITINRKYYFKPNETIKREDAFASIGRFLGYPINVNISELEKVYTDVKQISPSVRPLILGLYKNGILNGVGGGKKLNPKSSLTRAELAVLLYNTLNKLGRLNNTSNTVQKKDTSWYKFNDYSKYDPQKFLEISDEIRNKSFFPNGSFENGLPYMSDLKQDVVQTSDKTLEVDISSIIGAIRFFSSYEEIRNYVSLSQEDKVHGNNSLFYKGRLTGSMSIKPQTEYVFIAHVKKTTSSACTVLIYIKDKRIDIPVKKVNEWEQVVFRFTSPLQYSSLKKPPEFRFCIETTESVFVDDIILTEAKNFKDLSLLPDNYTERKLGSILLNPVLKEMYVEPNDILVETQHIRINNKDLNIKLVTIDGNKFYGVRSLIDNGFLQVITIKKQAHYNISKVTPENFIYNGNGDVVICSAYSDEYIFNGKKYKTYFPPFEFSDTTLNLSMEFLIPLDVMDKLAGGKFIIDNENGGVKKASLPFGRINRIPEIEERIWTNIKFNSKFYRYILNDEEHHKKINNKVEYLESNGILYEIKKGYNNTSKTKPKFIIFKPFTNVFECVVEKSYDIETYIFSTASPYRNFYDDVYIPLHIRYKGVGADYYIEGNDIYFYYEYETNYIKN